MKKSTFILLFFILNSMVYATTFHPVSNLQLIQKSEIIIKGNFLYKKYHELEDKTIATEMVFELESELGLDSKEFRIEEVSIYYPGGKVGDKHQEVEGVPQLHAGQKALILGRILSDGRIWGLSMGLGAFHVVKMGTKEMLINSIFPNDLLMSSWDWEHFQENVKKIKSVRIQRIYSDKYSIESHTQKAHTGKNRSIASDSDKRENKLLESEGTQAYVLVFLLAFLGGFSAFWSRHRKR